MIKSRILINLGISWPLLWYKGKAPSNSKEGTIYYQSTAIGRKHRRTRSHTYISLEFRASDSVYMLNVHNCTHAEHTCTLTSKSVCCCIRSRYTLLCSLLLDMYTQVEKGIDLPKKRARLFNLSKSIVSICLYNKVLERP